MSEERSVYFSNNGVPSEGLTPVWKTLKKVSDGTDISSQPSFAEVGGGWYRFTADVPIDEQWAGVIDGGNIIPLDSERYIPVLIGDNDIRRNTISVVTPQYDESSDTLQFMCFLLRNGETVPSAQLDSATVTVYDSSHTQTFSVTGSGSSNGVFVLAQNTPGLLNGAVYYAVAEITVGNKIFTSTETIITLD